MPMRPAILIAEPEPEQALSTRKLVIETGKFNVLTAHSSAEAEETLDAFPAVGAVVVHQGLRGYARALKKAKAMSPAPPIILLSPRGDTAGGAADHRLSSHDPQQLLELLRRLLGDPRKLPAQTG